MDTYIGFLICIDKKAARVIHSVLLYMLLPASAGDLASMWTTTMTPIACRATTDGSCLPALDGVSPAVNHFVLGNCSNETACGLVPDANAVSDALQHAAHLDNTACGRGDLASYYNARGVAVYFTVAQGDCAADTIALHFGLDSSPVVWQGIRDKAATSMYGLRHTAWFRECFAACCEYDRRLPAPLPVLSPALSPPAPTPKHVDGARCSSTGAASDLSDDVQHIVRQKRSAMAWGLRLVAGGSLLSDSPMPETVDGHLSVLSPDAINSLLEVHTKASTKGTPHSVKALPQYASAMLTTRWAVGLAYQQFLEGIHFSRFSFIVFRHEILQQTQTCVCSLSVSLLVVMYS